MNKGPTVTLNIRCDDCQHCRTKGYSCQGDSGTDVYCALMDMKTIGDTCWRTPEWCPLRAEAIRVALAAYIPAHAGQDAASGQAEGK